ncbi:MAG: shikimate dehydrogenase [Sumerlaeia bacterium]
MSTAPKKLAVIGWPVEHSKSPEMHNAAIKELGLSQEWHYEKHAVAPQDVPEFMAELRSGKSYQGCNVTIPHKIAAYEAVDELHDSARLIGAVNTIQVLPNGLLKGYNTDALGVFQGLAQVGCKPMQGAHILLIGAGGTARACIVGAMLSGAAAISIQNRTRSKAEDLVAEFTAKDPRFAAVKWQTSSQFTADELATVTAAVQLTSLGMKPETDALPLNPAVLPTGCTVLDAVYAPQVQTPFLKASQACGLKTAHGLLMLVGQGAESFRIWTGYTPNQQIMLQAIYHH